MPSINTRHSVRALILDYDDRILLVRCAVPEPAGTIVWVAPGGGIERGETPLAALRRELREEVGLVIDADPPHVWRQQVTGAGYLAGHHGVINDYYVIRTPTFSPRGAMSDDQLAAENISGWRWWVLREIVNYRGTDLFSPRDLGTPLARLLSDGVPVTPVPLGL
jgi:8-oxo-dGTP pyrophosphatase MutT (NUDIX family)